MSTPTPCIRQTQRWIQQVVIKNNFCPFAAAEVAQKSIHYQVSTVAGTTLLLQELIKELDRLDQHPAIATSFLIFSETFADFLDYLDFLNLAQALLEEKDYEGTYQLASFHPDYQFGGSSKDDPANYTNRSPFPMIHILREAEVEKALQNYLYPEKIPERNIARARKLGLNKMQAALEESRKEN